MYYIVDFGSWIQTMISLLTKRIFLDMRGMLFREKQMNEFSNKRQESLSQFNLIKCHMKISCGLCYVKKIRQQNGH
jgi:hypothetical protein